MFLYTLFAFVVIAALIFAAPVKAKVWVAAAIVLIGALWSSGMAVMVLATQRTIELWNSATPFLGSDNGSIDPLSAIFVLLISLGGTASALYSRGYLTPYLTSRSPAHISLHYTSLAVMFYAMLGVVCSDGGFSFLFCWELMTIASFLLILFDAERREVRRAALAYLIMMHIGFILLLIGFVQLHAANGSAAFTEISGLQSAIAPVVIFLAGFGMKAGVFPMHVWLPEAHPAAPSHVSALMSGVMIKTGVYGIIRVTMQIGDMQILHTVGLILLTAGVATGLWGIILAAMQNDIKRLLAYSSIENIGIILIGLGIAALGKSSGNNVVALCGFTGALLHTINHSLFKSLLFFGAGNILSRTHTTSLDSLGGLARHMPMTAIMFLTGTVALCALPPLNGFVSELLIYLGMLSGIASGSATTLASAAGIASLALIGGLAILAFTKLYGTVFLGSPRTHEVAEATEVDNFRVAAMALPLLGILFIGLFPQFSIKIVTRAASMFVDFPAGALDFRLFRILDPVSRTAWLLIVVVALLAWLRRRAIRRRSVRTGPTWGCGFTAVNTRMQYSGESFSEGLESIAAPLTQGSRTGQAVEKSELFPAAHNFDSSHKDHIDKLFAAWWVELLRVINKRAMRLRTGKINHYVLFALAFLVLIFLLSLFDVI